jgi:biotin synthase
MWKDINTLKMAPLIFRPLARPLLNRSYSTIQGASTSIATGASVSPWTSSTIPAVVRDATAAQVPRTTWTRDEVQRVYETPLSQLTHAAVRYDILSFVYLVYLSSSELIKVDNRQ